MPLSTYISVKWDQLLGYSIGLGFGLQGLKSAYKGLGNIAKAVHGAETYHERIEKASKDQLNILQNFKNLTVGSETLSERFAHLNHGVQHLAVSTVCSLFSYIIIFKAFEDPNFSKPTPPPDRTKLDADFNANLQKAYQISHSYKTSSCYITNFFHPSSRKNLEDCKPYFSDDFELPEDLTSMSLSEIERLLLCLEELSLNNKILSLIKTTPKIQENLQQARNSVIQALDQAAVNNTAIQKVSSNDLSSIQNGRNEEIKRALDEYLDSFYHLYNEVLNGYADYAQGYQTRLNHFKATNMTHFWGPFKIHLDSFCDEKLFDQLPIKVELSKKICSEYDRKKKSLKIAKDQRNTIKALNPSFSKTNCKSEVFDPIFEKALQQDLMLPPELYHMFLRLKNESKRRKPS